MVRLKKRASKRLGVAKREKVKKRVNEHHRKTRKDAKKDVTWKSRVKKDIGIPNSYPYKEQLLEEIQQKREAAEQAKVAAKEAARQRRAQNNEDDDETMGDEDAPAAAQGDDEASDAAVQASSSRNRPLTVKEYGKSLSQLLDDDTCAGIILALDARDPLAWDSRWLREQATAKGKPLLCALTRSDLVPLEVVVSWTEQLTEQLQHPVVPVSCLGAKSAGLEAIQSQTRQWTKGHSIVVCGYENSGRTTLARALQAKHADVQELVFFDSAHLIPANDADDVETPLRILLRNKGPLQRKKEVTPLLRAFMRKVDDVSDLQLIYRLPAFSAPGPSAGDKDIENACESFLTGLARRRGNIKKGNLPDLNGATRTLLRDWSAGELMYYAKPSAKNKGKAKAGAEDLTKVEGAQLLLPRKEWRVKFAQKELRLRPEDVDSEPHELAFANVARSRKVAFAQPNAGEQGSAEDDMMDQDEQDSEEDDEDESGDEEDIEEGDSGEDSVNDEVEGEEPVGVEDAAPSWKSSLRQSASAKRKAKPGEVYRLSDHF